MATNRATFAAGCFWGVEKMFAQHFRPQGTMTRVGYIGGAAEKPTYKQVCTGHTGHAEAVDIQFDPGKVSYENLVEFFFRMHDPTTSNRQGPDAGTQYRSAIFYHDEEQKNVAQQVKARVQPRFSQPIVTEIVPFSQWWDAEDYHQKYLDNNPHGYECPSHFLRW